MKKRDITLVIKVGQLSRPINLLIGLSSFIFRTVEYTLVNIVQGQILTKLKVYDTNENLTEAASQNYGKSFHSFLE